MELRGYRTSLEKMRKEIKVPALERSRLIDSEAKRITAEIVTLEEPIDNQIKELETRKEAERQAKIDAEVKRVEGIQERITELRGAVDAVLCMGAPSSEKVTEFINNVEKIAVDASFDEFREQAEDAKSATLSRLKEIHAGSVRTEKEAAKIKTEREELTKLRAEQEKREAEEQAKREAAEAEARKKREAEEKAERQKLEKQRKEQAEAQAKIDAENKRLANEKAAREKAEQKDRATQAKAEADAKKAEFPGTPAIIKALCEHFDVTETVVKTWLKVLQ